MVRHGPEAEADGATCGSRRGMVWRPEWRSRVGNTPLRGTSAGHQTSKHSSGSISLLKSGYNLYSITTLNNSLTMGWLGTAGEG